MCSGIPGDQKSLWDPGPAVKGHCELPDACWKLYLCPLEERLAPLTAEPPLQPNDFNREAAPVATLKASLEQNQCGLLIVVSSMTL